MIKRKDFEIRFTSLAKKDIDKLAPRLRNKLRDILEEIIVKNPYEGKKLMGELAGNYSYRLSYKDRIIYSINVEENIVYIKRARTHYGE